MPCSHVERRVRKRRVPVSDTDTKVQLLRADFVTAGPGHAGSGYVRLMARPPRIIEPGGIYHVYPRGNNKELIFWDDDDFRALLRILDASVQRYELLLYAYCLMPNHFHLVLRVPLANLSAAMQFVNGGYSRRTNIRYGRVRHLFQNRFEATQIADDSRLLTTLRYVVLNPVEAGLAVRPEDWRWSSHRATAGLALAPRFLAVTETLAFFSPHPGRARKAYRAFVRREVVAIA